MNRNLLVASILFLTLNTCIDPYKLKLNDYESLLVVNGLITDESAGYTIKLSRTFQDKDTLPEMVVNAEVSVSDLNGNIATFPELEPGIYVSDPDQFVGKIGESYTLHIRTPNGLEYESTPCLMNGVPEIDRIYFSPDNEFFDDGTVEESGIRIYLDADNKISDCKYFRWEFDEAWKFKIPYPVGFLYLGNGNIMSIPVENYVCWKYRTSKEVLIHSTETQQTGQISRQPLKFIAPVRSDRLEQQYSILVKQYSLSKSEYEFWSNLKQVSEGGGDIFEKQPFSVTGNIKSLSRKDEKIVGYFQVSAMKQKRRYITREDLKDFDLPHFSYSCDVIMIGPIDYIDPEAPSPYPPPSFDYIYGVYTGMGYVFVYPLYNGLSLERMAFTTKTCSDCSLTGEPDRPDFWVDLP